MKSIKNNITNLYEIEKSKFYCLLIKVNNIDEIKKELEDVKKNYKDATHYCYAYILDSSKKCSDDGEPSGTAGLPILNVLDQNELNHILCIVIRYFGGIKLGAGGLVRAYSKSVTNALDKCEIINLQEYQKLEIVFIYENLKQIDYLLKDYEIITKEYNENIIYNIWIPLDKEKDINNNLIPLTTKYTLKEKVLR